MTVSSSGVRRSLCFARLFWARAPNGPGPGWTEKGRLSQAEEEEACGPRPLSVWSAYRFAGEREFLFAGVLAKRFSNRRIQSIVIIRLEETERHRQPTFLICCKIRC